MKKKLLLPLLAGIAVIGACVFILVVVLHTRPGVTKANFDRIKIGMSRADIVEMFDGVPPVAGGGTRLRSEALWMATDGSAAWVWFDLDGRVVDSDWMDSTESFWDKLQRWVGLN